MSDNQVKECKKCGIELLEDEIELCELCDLKQQLQQLKEDKDEMCRILTFQIGELIQNLEPFKDPYFKGLPMEAIAELAKKSIRLGKENGELNNKLEDIANDFLLDAEDDDGFTIPILKQIYDALDAKNQDIEKFQEENIDLKKQVEELKNSVLSLYEENQIIAYKSKRAREYQKVKSSLIIALDALEGIKADCTNKATKCNSCALKKEPCTSYIAKQAIEKIGEKR